MNSLLLTDFYKVGHPFQYPASTTFVYSNLTPRKSMIPGVNKVVFFGLGAFMQKYLVEQFAADFFSKPKSQVIDEYKELVRTCLGSDLPTYKHIEDLHSLGYLPVEIKALPEGSHVPVTVPVLTINNTLPEFYWVTNFLETLMSASLWQASTSATLARRFRGLLEEYAEETGIDPSFIDYQGHDFSFRGMSSLESAVTSGMGHLLSFKGTDTIPAILALGHYYQAPLSCGASVPATEHAVACSYLSCVPGDIDQSNKTEFAEKEYFRHLIQDVYPTGIVSIVSDTWDLWKVCTEYMTYFKDLILSRDGKLVLRPDSGNPVHILCGNPDAATENERKGVIELLWEVFGGTFTDKGYKLLDSHIGVIYGDSINYDRAKAICEGLKQKGFASQVVFGCGSFGYQYNTRDTFGWAVKATYVEIDGVGTNIMKDPVTDAGKKSACGLLAVRKDAQGNYYLQDQCSRDALTATEMFTVFKDGQVTPQHFAVNSYDKIRERVLSGENPDVDSAAR